MTKTIHLLTGVPPLSRTACVHRVWSIYPQDGTATVEDGRRGRILVHYTLNPGRVTCKRCAAVLAQKADIRITSDANS